MDDDSSLSLTHALDSSINELHAQYRYTQNNVGISPGHSFLQTPLRKGSKGCMGFNINSTAHTPQCVIPNNQPLQRMLRVYKQSTGSLITTLQSDSSGFYSYRLISSDKVFIICFSGSDTSNGQIYTNIIPSEVIEGNEVQNIVI